MATGEQPQKVTKRGRPPTLTMPDPIPDTLDNVMDAVLSTPPKKRSEWKYIQRQEGLARGTDGRGRQ